jgi:hypothetical protein
VAVVGGAHAMLLVVDAGLTVLEVRGLAGSELTTAIALRDAVLLVNFAARESCRWA